MIILPQTIKTKWNSKHIKYYKSKGYEYTKIGDEFEVNVIDLPSTSQIKVQAKCDYCEKELTVEFFRANPDMKVSCIKCRSKRTQEEYGYSSTWQLPQTKESIKKTFLEKYGVDHNFKSPEVYEKRKQTFLKKYGVEYITQSKEIQEKIKQTSIKKRGVKHHLQDKTVQIKREQNNFKKYGVKFISQIPEIKQRINFKRINTLYKNQTGPCSKQQMYLWTLLGGELNYPIGTIMLDIAFPNEKIYIEFNGGGHDLPVKLGKMTLDDFNTKEIKREKFLQVQGWKLIRIVSIKDKLLNDDILIQLINDCKQYLLNHTWIEINIDENQIKCSEYIKQI